MNQHNFNRNPNYSKFEEDDDEEDGFLSRTGTFISSVFKTVVNSINPFNARRYVQNPYDLNSLNDPINNLNYLDNLNNNNNRPSNFNNSDNNLNRSTQIYLGDNNYEEDLNINLDFFTVEEFCNASPRLKDEIYKDIKRPNYIPNEELFQKAKKYVYDNLVKKYKIMKPKINDKIFGESVILLAIQLTNKYNIEKNYEFLVNSRRIPNYRLEINVPEIIKNYYTNKAKTLYHEDFEENSEEIYNNVNKELINNFSQGAVFGKNEQNFGNNNVNNSERENRLICRTPKTKRNYITCLFENKYNYDYLCPNEKVQCQIYKQCLLHKENELRNYARVIEATNNMFKMLCKENDKLRDIIEQKEKKIEKYAEEIILCKIKLNECQNKVNNYQEEIKNLKDNSKNYLSNLQNNPINNNLINNNNDNINSLQKNSPINKDISFGNSNSKSSAYTFKNPLEVQHENIFISVKKENNDICNSQKTATFNNKDSQNYSKSNKNNNDSNILLSLNNQSIDKNESQNKSENKESEQKNNMKFFSFSQSEGKKDEKENSNEVNKVNPFIISENKKKINFVISQKSNEEENKNENNGLLINNNVITDNNNLNKNNDNNSKPKIIFGFIPEEKNENKELKFEDKKETVNERKDNKENNKNENKKEEITDKINIKNSDAKENQKIGEKTEANNKNKESLNNPNNPFLSAAEIKTNEEFSVNSLKGEKDKIKIDLNERNNNRNTMDTSASFIKFGDISNLDNSNSFIIKPNNNLPESKSNSQGNPFILGQNNNIIKDNKNPFILENNSQNEAIKEINNNNSKNPFLSYGINNSNNSNNITNFNASQNLNDKNINNDNPFIQKTAYTQNNDSNSNNPFLSFNTNNNVTLSQNQNPFISQNSSNVPNIFNINNNNDSKSDNNPFVSNITNSNINNISFNNNNNPISSSTNPFISFGNNNNSLTNSNNLNSNNPFIKSQDSSNSPIFGQNNFSDINNSASNSGGLFNFKINTQENDKVNPFLANKNGFDFSSSNNSNNAFAMGVNMKKPGGNNYSIFDDNKSRKVNGFYN